MRSIIVILLFVFTVSGHAQTRAELEEQRKKALEDIEYVDNLLKQTAREKSETMSQLNILSKKLGLREQVIRSMREEVELLQNRIELNELAISMMEDDLDLLVKEYEKAIIHAQKASKSQPGIMYIFSARDLNQGYKRMRYLQQVARYRRREAEIIKELASRIESNKSEQEEDLAAIIELREREQQQANAILGEQQNRRKIISNLGRKERQLKQDLDNKRRIAAAIEKEIARVIEEERKRREMVAITPEEQLLGDDFEKNRGRLPWPVERGVVTSQFGVHDHPVFKGTKVDNIGIEISSGSRVKARVVFSGKVMSVFGISGGNMAVIVRHGKFLTIYQNLVNVTVKPGDNVTTKQVIGDVFSDPAEGDKSTLKFMIYEEKTKLDPEPWLAKIQ
ncbi:MAG: peptidoglycan DD-metalloendopeptidase family protein [Bacteroidales bacterium]